MNIHRRTALKLMVGAGGLLAAPRVLRAQTTAPFKLGLLTVKTGPLAEGGIQMEQGVRTWLKLHDNKMAGRKVEFFSTDTGGDPAGCKPFRRPRRTSTARTPSGTGMDRSGD
jgi:branched-chain amino acid transport system substrate-binding protein